MNKEITNEYGEKLLFIKSNITRKTRIFLGISKNGKTSQMTLENEEIEKLKKLLNDL